MLVQDLNLRELTKKYGRGIGLNIRAVRPYAAQMLWALHHLRNCGVLHSDIKPDNILVSEVCLPLYGLRGHTLRCKATSLAAELHLPSRNALCDCMHCSGVCISDLCCAWGPASALLIYGLTSRSKEIWVCRIAPL